jgi:hypothetical protein
MHLNRSQISHIGLVGMLVLLLSSGYFLYLNHNAKALDINPSGGTQTSQAKYSCIGTADKDNSGPRVQLQFAQWQEPPFDPYGILNILCLVSRKKIDNDTGTVTFLKTHPAFKKGEVCPNYEDPIMKTKGIFYLDQDYDSIVEDSHMTEAFHDARRRIKETIQAVYTYRNIYRVVDRDKYGIPLTIQLIHKIEKLKSIPPAPWADLGLIYYGTLEDSADEHPNLATYYLSDGTGPLSDGVDLLDPRNPEPIGPIVCNKESSTS